MAISNAHKHTAAIVQWYVCEYPSRIVRGYAAYARAFMEIIPLPFLLLTLIKPWKNIRERKMEHGFNLQLWFERLIFNIFSRTVGAVVRILTMVLGVVLHIVLFTVSLLYLVLWITFPAITITALILLFRLL